MHVKKLCRFTEAQTGLKPKPVRSAERKKALLPCMKGGIELNDAQLDRINQLLGESLAKAGFTFSISADYRYWSDEKGNRWFYTVGKIMHKGKLRLVAGRYSYLKTKKQYRLTKKVGDRTSVV